MIFFAYSRLTLVSFLFYAFGSYGASWTGPWSFPSVGFGSSPFLDRVLGLAVFSVIHGSCFSVQLRSLSGSPFASFGVGIFPSTCAWLVFRTLQPRMAHDMHSLSAFHFVRLLRGTVALFFCWFYRGMYLVHWLRPQVVVGFASHQFLHVEILFASRSMDSGSVFIYVWCEFHAVHSFQFVLLVVCRVSWVECKMYHEV